MTASHYSFHSHPKVMLEWGWKTGLQNKPVFWGPALRAVGQTGLWHTVSAPLGHVSCLILFFLLSEFYAPDNIRTGLAAHSSLLK